MNWPNDDSGQDWSPARLGGPLLSRTSPQVQERTTTPPALHTFLRAAQDGECDLHSLIDSLPDSLAIPYAPAGIMARTEDSPVTGKRTGKAGSSVFFRVSPMMWALGDHGASDQDRMKAVASLRSAFPHNFAAPDTLVWAAAVRPEGLTPAGGDTLASLLRMNQYRGEFSLSLFCLALAAGVYTWDDLTGSQARCRAHLTTLREADTMRIEVVLSIIAREFSEACGDESSSLVSRALQAASDVESGTTSLYPDQVTPLIAASYLLSQCVHVWREQAAGVLPGSLVTPMLDQLGDVALGVIF